jgi:diadenosine tetraphosphate (Ap4A) HIT family hydrolase
VTLREAPLVACDMCAEIHRIESGADPNAVARLATGYVTLRPTQYFRGYTVFSAKSCVREIYDLPPAERDAHLREMAEVAHALARAFEPRKLNYEALGNGTPHLHWHLIPRYATDPHPRGPAWEDLAFLRELWTGGATLDDREREESKRVLLRELRRGDVEIEREFLVL